MAERVVITGGSGFLGTALTKRLQREDYEVVVIDLVPPTVEGVQFIEADLSEGIPRHRLLEKPNFYINLAGSSILGRWTNAKLQSIYDSRILSTKQLVKLFNEPLFRPQALISASSVAYYGDTGFKQVDERTLAGQGFLARVFYDWETTAREAEKLGVRTTIIRNAHILGPGGLLDKSKPFHWFKLSPVFGEGSNCFPWIHLDDLVSLYALALRAPNIPGTINAVAPAVTTAVEFARAVGRVRGLRVVKLPLNLVTALLGDFGKEMGYSQCAISSVLQNSDFHWQHQDLHEALLATYRISK